jgi:hypothetical protein
VRLALNSGATWQSHFRLAQEFRQLAKYAARFAKDGGDLALDFRSFAHDFARLATDFAPFGMELRRQAKVPARPAQRYNFVDVLCYFE